MCVTELQASIMDMKVCLILLYISSAAIVFPSTEAVRGIGAITHNDQGEDKFASSSKAAKLTTGFKEKRVKLEESIDPTSAKWCNEPASPSGAYVSPPYSSATPISIPSPPQPYPPLYVTPPYTPISTTPPLISTPAVTSTPPVTSEPPCPPCQEMSPPVQSNSPPLPITPILPSPILPSPSPIIPYTPTTPPTSSPIITYPPPSTPIITYPPSITPIIQYPPPTTPSITYPPSTSPSITYPPPIPYTSPPSPTIIPIIPPPPSLENPPSTSPTIPISPSPSTTPYSPPILPTYPPPYSYETPTIPSPATTLPPPTSTAPTLGSPPPPYYTPSTPAGQGLWCVAKPTVSASLIEQAMNYACGAGADCQAVQPNGACYLPDTVISHASYAFNNYFQATKGSGGSCDFGGTAMIVTVDPSYDGCHYLYNYD